MIPEHRLVQIIGTIHVIKAGAPIPRRFVVILLDPWSDLSRDAMDREGKGWINLLQAAAARIERVLK
jgi:hypothetical protein